MRTSVSLPDEDVRFLDEQGKSRSAVLQQAVALLRERQLAGQYAEAFEEWGSLPDAPLWDAVARDVLPA